MPWRSGMPNPCLMLDAGEDRAGRQDLCRNATAELLAVVLAEKGTHDRAWVEASLEAGGKECATCRGLFVAVTEGHPAYHRW